MRYALIGIVLLSCAGLALRALGQGSDQEQEEPKKKRWWAIDAGVYRPTSEEIRDRFGDYLFRVGVRPFGNELIGSGKPFIDATILTARQGSSHLFVLPVTLGFITSTGDENDDTISFASVGVGPAYYNYKIKRLVGSTIVTIKESTFGWSAHAEIGIRIQKRLTITGRYDWFSESNDFDFSGFSLNLSYAAFRW